MQKQVFFLLFDLFRYPVLGSKGLAKVLSTGNQMLNVHNEGHYVIAQTSEESFESLKKCRPVRTCQPSRLISQVARNPLMRNGMYDVR